jgi:iron complex transport system substrate-binding protein
MSMLARAVLALIALIGTLLPVAVFAQSRFPVTIEHAYGATTIEAEPERVVTWGWAAQDTAIALGVVPVGIPYFAYGGDENGMLSWTKEAIAELGAEMPTVLENSQTPPVEQIAALQPDLIVAVYSGLTREEYDILSQIAPVVAFPGEPWSTPWQETITITGKAIGKGPEAEALVADLEQFIADETAKYPQVQGTTFAGISEYNGAVAIYAGLDSRMKFLEDAGLVLAPSVSELAQGESFFFSLSFENFEQLTSDILITYFETPATNAAFFDKSLVAAQPQVQAGAVAEVVGAELINSVSPPSALSLKWGYPEYIRLIAEAATNAGR